MNRRVSKRIAKKIAKRYLDGRDVSRYLLGTFDYWVGYNAARGELLFPYRIEKEIRKEARRRGWKGDFSSNPLAIYWDYGDGPEYGYGARMNTRLNH